MRPTSSSGNIQLAERGVQWDNSNMDNSLQKLVKNRLAELGVGPVEAATRAGLNRFFIRDLVAGKKVAIKADKIDQLARALDLEPSQLYLASRPGDGESHPSIESRLALLPREDRDDLMEVFDDLINAKLRKRLARRFPAD